MFVIDKFAKTIKLKENMNLHTTHEVSEIEIIIQSVTSILGKRLPKENTKSLIEEYHISRRVYLKIKWVFICLSIMTSF